ncbi:MAG: family 43 glycosylhydrolase [Catenulispora sp.]|nr:family 43 glycosylhydrolase [Catenulispora sp.]
MTEPIIPGFHPDPSICQVGEGFYLANSSFEYLPGVPIHRSDDLLRWTLIGNALTRSAQTPPNDGVKQSGIYAPTLRHHGSRFWLATTDVTQVMRGQMILVAERAEGPWSDPVFVAGAIGIDPDLVWDEDGVCHLSWKSFPDDAIMSVPIDPVSGTMLEKPRLLWSGTGLAYPEGPHLYRVGEWWYLLVAEGGTERGHAISVARSRSLYEPFDAGPANPILSHRSTDHSVQNTGHGDLIRLPDDSWAMVYLGVRARGVTPHFHVNGRETFLAGIDWVDGWPVVDVDRFPVSAANNSFIDDFATALHARWVSPGNYPSSLARLTPSGLELRSQPGRKSPAMLLARAVDVNWSVDITLNVTEGVARLLLRIDDEHWYGLDIGGGAVEAVLAIGPAVTSVGRRDLDGPMHVTARIRVSLPSGADPLHGAMAPDLIELALVSSDGAVDSFGCFDGRYLSTEVAGGFTGRMWGIEVLHGSIIVKRVAYTGSASPDTVGIDM